MADPLAALEARVARDLRLIAYPEVNWVPSRRAPDGTEALDVLVVGAGQGGLAIAFALARERVSRVRVIDHAPEGREGPWLDYARMKTLRSWKTVTGPDLDIPSLTYQSWHEARYGTAHFAALGKIAKEDWAAYLAWFRRVLALPVSNDTGFLGVSPQAGLLAARLREAGGERTVWCRKLVLAHGIEASGRWWMPPEVEALPARLRAHTADAIDFARLAGRRIAVLGAGASAFDNAASALEAGAAGVRLFVRRAAISRIQPYRYLSFSGYFRHFRELDDATRWRYGNHLLTLREALPRETWERCHAHAAFEMIEGAPWDSVRAEGGGVTIDTPQGTYRADFVIGGTGFDVDLAARPELAGVAEHVALWADRYTPPAGEENPRLARYPYLGPDFEFAEKVPGAAPWLRNIRVFTFGTTMSFGPSGSSINAMKFAVPRLVAGLTRDFFREDAARFYEGLRAYATPEFGLEDVSAPAD